MDIEASQLLIRCAGRRFADYASDDPIQLGIQLTIAIDVLKDQAAIVAPEWRGLFVLQYRQLLAREHADAERANLIRVHFSACDTLSERQAGILMDVRSVRLR